jgi:mRNA-degrading endonuclease toxin of MazEF toxin-antitoxin module
MRNRLVKDDSHPRHLRTIDREHLCKRIGEVTAATLDTVFGRLGALLEP